MKVLLQDLCSCCLSAQTETMHWLHGFTPGCSRGPFHHYIHVQKSAHRKVHRWLLKYGLYVYWSCDGKYIYRSTFGLIISPWLGWLRQPLQIVVFVTIIENVRKAFHKLRDNLVGTDLKEDSLQIVLSVLILNDYIKKFYVTLQKRLYGWPFSVSCIKHKQAHNVLHLGESSQWALSITGRHRPSAVHVPWAHSREKAGHKAEQQGTSRAAETSPESTQRREGQASLLELTP